jgi:hypothetical protein
MYDWFLPEIGGASGWNVARCIKDYFSSLGCKVAPESLQGNLVMAQHAYKNAVTCVVSHMDL